MSAPQLAAVPSNAIRTAEQFVELIGKQNLEGVVELYAPTAVWEVHVPGWDDMLLDHQDILQCHRDFFGRDQFRIDRYEFTTSGERVAMNWDLGWRDRQSGFPVLSFQSHFFTIRDGKIVVHRMYCAGVRIYPPAETTGEEG